MRYLTLGEVIELHGRVLQVGGGHATMETFLILNSAEIAAAVDEQGVSCSISLLAKSIGPT